MKIQTKKEQAAAIAAATAKFQENKKVVIGHRPLDGYKKFSQVAYAAFTGAAFGVTGWIEFTDTGSYRTPKKPGHGGLLGALLDSSARNDMKGRRGWINVDNGDVTEVHKVARDAMTARIKKYAEGGRQYACALEHIRAFEEGIKKGGKVTIKVDDRTETYTLDAEVKRYV